MERTKVKRGQYTRTELEEITRLDVAHGPGPARPRAQALTNVTGRTVDALRKLLLRPDYVVVKDAAQAEGERGPKVPPPQSTQKDNPLSSSASESDSEWEKIVEQEVLRRTCESSASSEKPGTLATEKADSRAGGASGVFPRGNTGASAPPARVYRKKIILHFDDALGKKGCESWQRTSVIFFRFFG